MRRWALFHRPSSVAGHNPAGIASTRREEHLRLLLVAGAILLALGAAVVPLRLLGLDDYPPRLDSDEAIHGLDALQVRQGEHSVFFPENHGREGLIVYTIALSISFFGRTELAIRLPTALASAIAVFVVFWLGHTLFGRNEESGQSTSWRGLIVGGVGAGLMAVSLGQTIIGRTAMRGNFLPLLIPLCLVLLWNGYSKRSWWRIALAGVCAGLLPYTYIAARFTLLLFLMFGISFLLSHRSAIGVRIRYDLLHQNLPWTVIFLGVAGLVAAPILIHFGLHPEDFFSRSSKVWVLDGNRSEGGPLQVFLVNIWENLLLFGFRGDPALLRNLSGRPMLNLWEAFFFWLGAGIALWRRRPADRLMLLWIGALILPAILARDSAAPNTLRMIGAVPAIYLLTGVGLWETFRFLWERVDLLPRPMVQILQENESKIFLTGGALAFSLILFKGVSTYSVFYERWAEHPDVSDSYETWLGNWARTLEAFPSDRNTVYLVPCSPYTHPISTHFSFMYLYQGTASARSVYMSAPDLAYQIETILAERKETSTVKVVEWNTTNRWVRDNARPVTFLLSKYGTFVDSEMYTDFRIHNYEVVSSERSWTFYEEMEPLTVHYDGGISLHGIALGAFPETIQFERRNGVSDG